ncbi:hypothetical protein EKL97_15270 [Flavobacterium sp. LS1P28]|uniref:hypothetical protein n=1 Tax=Flavobacterium sp. LS1P28 TaxID=2497752 RepID=UPI000F81DD32|nr:hypothetical protein [Flavobacterium sp. LS1P28]RTY77502.1 hypothetical protein EKL97_15270 [Flavobacterium sp. LS1P28]
MNKSSLYKFLTGVSFLIFFSCEEILLEKDISEEIQTLIAPANEAQFFSTGVTFTWESVPDATKYQLQIAKPNFENPMQIVLDTLVTTHRFTQQLPIGDYEWRVRATNSAYNTNYSSRLISIVSDADFQSNTVVLNTPTNNLITKTALQNLTWQPIIGASSYQLQVYDGNNVVISDQTMTATALNYTFLEGSYFWRVRATNGTQQTLYSSHSVLIDTKIPNTPVLSSPATTSTTTNKEVSFQWNRTPISGSAEKDSIYIYTDNALTVIKLKNEASSPFATNLDLGIYYWFVKSFDKAGNESNKSTVFSFTVN